MFKFTFAPFLLLTSLSFAYGLDKDKFQLIGEDVKKPKVTESIRDTEPPASEDKRFSYFDDVKDLDRVKKLGIIAYKGVDQQLMTKYYEEAIISNKCFCLVPLNDKRFGLGVTYLYWYKDQWYIKKTIDVNSKQTEYTHAEDYFRQQEQIQTQNSRYATPTPYYPSQNCYGGG